MATTLSIETGPPAQDRSQVQSIVRNVTAGVIGAALLISFTVVHVVTFVHTGRVVGAGLAATELITAILFLVRRTPMVSTNRPSDWAVAVIGCFGSLLARPGGAHSVPGDAVGLGLQVAGLAVVLVCLVAMGRSFGVVPANRGIVSSGPYRVIRHPLYAAYVIEQVGYILQSVRPWNIALFAAVWACQVARIRAEERVLGQDPSYQTFRQTTPYRLVPGLW
jgi:protein-S-isoprenylcysteine O-methyltransferase Ste14